MVDTIVDPLVLSDYPNLLLEPSAKRFSFPHRPFLLMGLVLLCLAPRVIIATKCSSVCPDATLYIKLARSIDAGQLHCDSIPLQILTYPAIISALHRVGFDWESGARFWGIMLSSLAVLPLFGWIRYQFDDRVALAGCFLYAVHQRFVEWSPSIIRDQTFWFLFALSLYLLWRAVIEVRPFFYVAFGIAATLSAMMRAEGLLLLIPFLIWTLFRCMALRQGRWRLAFGAAMVLLVCPGVLFIVGVVFFHFYPGEQVRELPEIVPVRKWQASISWSFQQLLGNEELSSSSGDPSGKEASASEKPLPVGPEHIGPMPPGKMLWEYVRALESGVTAVYGLLMFYGLWRWRRVWAQRGSYPIFMIAVIILAGIWLDFYYGQQTCQRYLLTIVIISLPVAAMALLEISQWCGNIVCRRGLDVRRQKIALFAPAIFVALVNFAECSAKRYEIWESYAHIGHWMRAELDEPPNVAGHEAVVKVASYYSNGSYISIPRTWGPAAIAKIAANKNIDFFLLSERAMRDYDTMGLLAELDRLGFQQVDSFRLPPGTNSIMVFERKPAVPAKSDGALY